MSIRLLALEICIPPSMDDLMECTVPLIEYCLWATGLLVLLFLPLGEWFGMHYFRRLVCHSTICPSFRSLNKKINNKANEKAAADATIASEDGEPMA